MATKQHKPSESATTQSVQHALVSLDALTPHPRNYRQHPETQLSRLSASLARFGQVRSIVVQEGADGRYLLVAGHGLAEAARANGYTELRADVIPATWSAQQIEGYLIADNETTRGADDDLTQLAAMLEEQRASGEHLESLGYSDEELATLLDDLSNAALAGDRREVDDPDGGGDDFDTTPEESGPTRCQPGDLWVLGSHRLLCGDSTRADDVARLMDGALINIVFTSPPYASQREYDKTTEFRPIPPDEYVDWYAAIQAPIAAYLEADGSYFLNIKEHCEDGQRSLYVKDLTLAHVREWGWRFVDELCWTRAGVPGGWNNRFKNGWEPVFHFSRQQAIKFRPDAVSHETEHAFDYSPANGKSISGSGLLGKEHGSRFREGTARPSNVLNVGTGGARTTGEHPAEFPVGLPAFFFQAYSDTGDVVYEPFGGSGTALIAADRLERRCYALEISPRYCDVILRRWEAETGREATLLERVSASEEAASGQA